MLRSPALCSVPLPEHVTRSPTGTISAGRKQVAQSLGSLKRFAQTLPYILPAPISVDRDSISTLLLNAQILQPCTQALQQPSPHVEVSLQDSSLHISYRPAWFQSSNITTAAFSETDYDTPAFRFTSEENKTCDPKALFQRLEDATDSVHGMLMSSQRNETLIASQLTVIFQDFISLRKEIAQRCSSMITQIQWKQLLDTRQQDEKDIFDELDMSLQTKIISIDLLHLSVSMELYVQLRQQEAAANRLLLPTFTAKEAESLLLQCTDSLVLISSSTDNTVYPIDERLALLEIATKSLQMFYSSACQVIPGTHSLDVSYEHYFLADINYDLLNRQLHLLLDILGNKGTPSIVCADIMAIFSLLWKNDQVTMLLLEVFLTPFTTGVKTSSISKSVAEQLIQSILEHALDATISIKDDLYKPLLLYRNIVLPKVTFKPPPILLVLTKLFTLISSSTSRNSHTVHPKLVLQTLLQQLSVIINQKTSMMDSRTSLTALLYQYIFELSLLPNGAPVLWRDLPPIIVSFCDRQCNAQLSNQAITTFIRLMLDMLGFIFLLALRDGSSVQAKQCSSQLLSFFLSFFSIISKNVQLQIHIISLLSRLSGALQLAKNSHADASVSLDASANLLQEIDSCLLEIYIGTINSVSPSISLLDASLTSLTEPIQNNRFLPDYIVKLNFLPKLKDLLRTTGSLALIKSIVQLFVLLVDRYYVESQVSAASLAVQLNNIMTVIMSIVIFTRDNTIAVGITSILLPAMRATLPPIGTVWKRGHNSINRSAGLLICITSQNENRLSSFFRAVLSMGDQHRLILRDLQREVLRRLHGLLFNLPKCVANCHDQASVSADAILFSQFSDTTLALIFFNFCGLSIILADELGDNRDDMVPLCASQKEQCPCNLMNRHDTDTSTELEPKIKCRAVPLYGKPSRSEALRPKAKFVKQTKRGPDTTTCLADSAANMLLSITRMLTDILPNILQCAVLTESAAAWIEAYIANDEHRKLFQTYAFRVIALGARIHIHCLFRVEKSGDLGSSGAHMTVGNLLDQYNSIMSLLCFMIDTADIHVIEHVVSCLTQYARWDLFYRGSAHSNAQSLHILCKVYAKICISSSRLLVQAGCLKEASELVCICAQLNDNMDMASTTTWSIAKHLYLLALVARGFTQFNEKGRENIQAVLIRILLPHFHSKTTEDEVPIAYSTPVSYVFRLLMKVRTTAPDLIHFVAVCQYTLLGALPLMFIQSTDDAAVMLATLKADCSQPSLHPLIANAIFYATAKFFGTSNTDDIVSSVCSSIASEDTDSESKISLASLSSTLKSPSSATDYERPLVGVYISAKVEEKRLHIHKRFVHTILPYCHAVLSRYYLRGLFPSSSDDNSIITKTIVHILYCIRQIVVSKLMLPECIVPNLLMFQLTACYFHNKPSTMTIVYEDVLDTLTLSLTVFKQVMCVVAVEKALQLLFTTDEWKALVRNVADKNQVETTLQSIQVPIVVVTDLYNLLFLESDAIGVPKQKDADALFISTTLNCLELPTEHNEGDWHDTLLRLFFLLYIFIKLPLCKYKSSLAVGTVIRHFSDYTVHQYQRLLLLDSTDGETLPHTFVYDLFVCLADCIVKLFTYYFNYTVKGEKEEIGKEPHGSPTIVDDIACAVAQSLVGPSESLKALIEIRDSMS
ncbi:Hypothetical protein GLP15_3342 [Giardia lamblia P15]|uniref:Uncharacterized protein n=1 Tax=Giardia intestinalis (strain P15) TaxID=658858 RepID=E1EVU0_GIAIA|nr:Hypothetical protein GLP15_3342 [Giardia lamblia P15]